MTNSAVPPCLPEIRPLCTVPSHRLPVNAGNASEDTEANLFPLPSAAHLLLRFSRRSQPEETLNKSSAINTCRLVYRFLGDTLCGCAGNFTPASMVCGIMLCLLYYKCVRLSRTKILHEWTNSGNGRPVP